MTPRRDLTLSYFAEIDKDGNQGQVYFASLLDRLNTQRLHQDKRAPRLVLREQGSSLSMAEVEEVQKHLSQLNAQTEKTAQLSFLKGIDHLLLQDLGAAISALTEAIERDPSLPWLTMLAPSRHFVGVRLSVGALSSSLLLLHLKYELQLQGLRVRHLQSSPSLRLPQREPSNTPPWLISIRSLLKLRHSPLPTIIGRTCMLRRGM